MEQQQTALTTLVDGADAVHTGVDDAQLVLAMAGGATAALEAFYARHASTAYALAWRMVGDGGLAEDVVQEAFLALWRQAGCFDPARGSAQAWLCGIVRHRALDALRRRKGQMDGESDELAGALADGDRDVESVVVLSIEGQRLRAAVRALPHSQRQAVELAYFGGLTHHEIAARLGVPLGTVKGRLRLALRKLHACLTGEGSPRGTPVAAS
jgi:RNA polymerase sigma-70 factor (ECF subfamily)